MFLRGNFILWRSFDVNKIELIMKKVKVIDLFGVKYDQMEEKVNDILDEIQEQGGKVHDVKILGSKLSQCAVFVYYEE